MNTIKNVRAITWVLLAALALRLMLALIAIEHPERAHAPDTASYLAFARLILNGQGQDYISAHRTPGYPLFLAGMLALFGEQTLPMVIAQAIISTATIGAAYWLARRFFDEKSAILAALLLALSTESITHSFYLLTETLFTFLFLLSTCFLWLARGKNDWKTPTLAGVLLGLGILTRPLVSYYPLLVLAILMWDSTPLKTRLRSVIVFILACGLVIAPWLVRNDVLMGRPFLSTISNFNLLHYNAAYLQAENTGQDEDEVRDEFKLRVSQILSERHLPETEANQAEVWGELGSQIILSDPIHYTVTHLKSDLNNLLPDTDLLEILGISAGQKGTLGVLKQHGLVAAIRHYFDGNLWAIGVLVPSILLLGLAYLGWGTATLQMLWKKQFFPLVFLSLPILYGLLIPGSPSNPRFRVPVMPFIVILAATGIFSLIRLARRKN